MVKSHFVVMDLLSGMLFNYRNRQGPDVGTSLVLSQFELKKQRYLGNIDSNIDNIDKKLPPPYLTR